MKVGIYQNEPKVFLDDSGKASGFLPALVEHFAERFGWRVTYVPCAWEACLTLLESGEIQLMPDVAYSSVRAKRFQFGHEAALFGWSYIFARPGAPLTELAGLDGKSVAVVADSIQATTLRLLAAERGWTISLVGRPAMREVLAAVERGEADYGVVNRFFAEANEQDFDLVRTQVLFLPSPVYFAYGNEVEPALIDQVDLALARLKTEPDSLYFQLYEEWLEPREASRIPNAVYWAGGGVLAALIGSFAVTGVFRRRVAAATADLADANRRMAMATQSAQLGIWDWDIENDVLHWDETTGRLYGRPAGDAEKGYEGWRDALHPDDRARAEADAERALHGQGEFESEFRIVRPDGEIRHVKANGLVLRRSDGKPHRMIGLNMDMTERKSLEEQLRQSQKLEAMGQLTGGIAHDFNNLLTVIVGNAEMLAERFENDRETTRQVTQIQLASERATSLTGRLLAFSRRQTLSPGPTDIAALLNNTREMLQRPLGATIELRIDCEPGLRTAHVDAHQLENALVNLAINARDAMPGGGLLSIEAANATLPENGAQPEEEPAPGNYVRIVVRDSGKGMVPAVLEKVFDPFFTTKRIGEGTGLGLSMVYGFVKQSRGHIRIESAPGEGTKVVLYLPCEAAG